MGRRVPNSNPKIFVRQSYVLCVRVGGGPFKRPRSGSVSPSVMSKESRVFLELSTNWLVPCARGALCAKNQLGASTMMEGHGCSQLAALLACKSFVSHGFGGGQLYLDIKCQMPSVFFQGFWP